MIDEDEINLQNKLNWRQQQEERELKNRILRMSNPQKKQAEWRKHFQAYEPLTANEVY